MLNDETLHAPYGWIYSRSCIDRGRWWVFDSDSELFMPMIVDDFGNMVYIPLPF